ncbi:Replication factor A protein 2 [Rhodotorula kratochvilovae]
MSYAGGGFMSQGGSQSSPGGGKRSGTSALRPVTIHQLLNAEQAFAEAEFYVDGAEIKDVTLVACIRNISSTQTQLNMLVEDGTGQMDARSWKDPAAEDSNPYEDFQINTYVRIIGQLKTFNGKRHINVNRFRRIDDFNEILFHPVEAIYVHKYYRDGPPGGAGAGINAINNTTFDAGANPYAAGGAATGGGGAEDVYAELPSVQRSIMHFVTQQVASGEAGEEGVNVNSIVRTVGGNADRVRQDYETLISDGHLYQTIDDDHVLPTAA